MKTIKFFLVFLAVFIHLSLGFGAIAILVLHHIGYLALLIPYLWGNVYLIADIFELDL